MDYSTNSVTFDPSRIQTSQQSSDIIVQSFNLFVDSSTTKVPSMEMHTGVTDPICSFTTVDCNNESIQSSE